MSRVSLPLAALVLLASAATPTFAQSLLYDQPMFPGGGTLRNSQLWVDPLGKNDSDNDAIAWEDFELAQDFTLTHLSWCGTAPKSLGFLIAFFDQDPNTIAVQPDIFAAGSHPISQETYTSFSQVSLGNNLYRFDVDLVQPLQFQANTRYFVSVIGLTPIFYDPWNWAQTSSGPNGTFWWMRGLHMYYHLPESRAMSLEGTWGAACTPPAAYCTAKPSSQGCTPAIDFSGAPSYSGASAFQITASQFLNNKPGLLFYGSAPASTPFMGGTLCVTSPITRTTVQASGGSATGSDCSGTYAYDFGARILSGADPSLIAGAVVCTQYWARDPADPTGFGISLSNALSFQICP